MIWKFETQIEIDNLEVAGDYSLPLKRLIELGKFDAVNDDIAESNFQIDWERKSRGRVDLDLKVVSFNRQIRSHELESELEELELEKLGGFKPVTVFELCFIAEQYPDLQRARPIVASGLCLPRWDGHFSVPYLGGDRDERFLDLYLMRRNLKWPKNFRFAALPKSSK